MVKKKPVKSEDEIDENLEDDDLEDDELEFPKIEKETEKVEESEGESDESEEEDSDIEIEEEGPRFPDYVYLDLNLIRAHGDNDFELMVEGQSHGFLNIFVRFLLETPGVTIAAYKITGIELPKIYIRLDNLTDYDIKKVLFKATESLREEVIRVQKIFQILT